jgi:hypothetical protein
LTRLRDITHTNEVVDSVGKNVSKPKNLGGRPPVDELAHLRSQITKQLKLKSKEQLVLILQMVGGKAVSTTWWTPSNPLILLGKMSRNPRTSPGEPHWAMLKIKTPR